MDGIRLVAPQMSATRCALTKSSMSADQSADSMPQTDLIRLFLCGDVMTGRGIDQVLPHPNDPALHEPCIGDARFYVKLAESVNGAITRPVTADYIWGDALAELRSCRRGSAHHQSRDKHHFERALLARQGDPLPPDLSKSGFSGNREAQV